PVLPQHSSERCCAAPMQEPAGSVVHLANEEALQVFLALEDRGTRSPVPAARRAYFDVFVFFEAQLWKGKAHPVARFLLRIQAANLFAQCKARTCSGWNSCLLSEEDIPS